MKKETVSNFLSNGALHHAPFGIDKKMIIERFGPPGDVLTVSENDDRIAIMKYGVVEFYFTEESVYEKLGGILFQPMIYPSETKHFEVDLEWVREGLTYAEVQAYLSHTGVIFEAKYDEFEQPVLETASRVRFYFAEDKGKILNHWELNKFGRFV